MLYLQSGLRLLLQFRRRGSALICVTLCVCLLLSGCRKVPESDSGIVVESEIAPQPTRIGPATITLKINDRAGKPVSGAKVSLEGDMSHAGMSPVFSDASETGPGLYRARLEFTMAGDWVILVHVTLQDGRKIEREFDVKGVQSG